MRSRAVRSVSPGVACPVRRRLIPAVGVAVFTGALERAPVVHLRARRRIVGSQPLAHSQLLLELSLRFEREGQHLAPTEMVGRPLKEAAQESARRQPSP
jgi:hypothetical protein